MTKSIYSLSVCLLVVFSTAVAQQKTARTTAKLGVVSGRVFAITKGGDIKPARMAKVYLLWKYHSLDEALAEEKKGINHRFAALTFRQQRNKAVKANLEERQRDAAANNYWSDSLSCSKDLLAVDDAITATLQWSLDQKKTHQVLATSADEEGNFRMTAVCPGVYDLIARGRAGFNEAFWHTDDLESGLQDITVAAGIETTVKLASPVISCLELGDDH